MGSALKAEAAASFSSQYNSESIVRQVLSVLRPNIMALISDAIAQQAEAAAAAAAAAEAARLEEIRREEERRKQALLEQQRQEALRQQALREQQRQQALLEQQRQQALFQQQQQQQSSSLTSLFGNGNIHQVKFEVPGQFKEEYSIGN